MRQRKRIMMFHNSEIQRYYWQNFTLQRRIAMPVVLIAIALLLYLTNLKNMAQVIATYAKFAYFVVVFLWGGYQAAHALVQEVKENTWDNQRLSSVSPWSLTLGKLFGSTLYPWYGGFILLLIYFFAAMCNAEPTSLVLLNLLLLVGTGILGHAVALFTSLIPLRMQNGRGQFHVAAYFILGLIVSGYSLALGSNIFSTTHFEQGVKWYYLNISDGYFFLGTLFFSLFWFFLAVYRFVRQALQFKNTPIIWGAFIIFCMVYFSGFLNNFSSLFSPGLTHRFPPEHYMGKQHPNQLIQHYNNIYFYIAFSVGIMCTYFSFFSENLNIIRYRILFYRYKEMSWHRVMHLIPMWAVSFGLTLLVGIISFFFVSDVKNLGSTSIFVISSLIFLLRDACIFHYFTLVPNGRLPTLAALFYLGISYWLIPGLVFAVVGNREALMGFFGPVYPMVLNMKFTMLIPGLIELAIAVWLLQRRYHKINAQMVV